MTANGLVDLLIPRGGAGLIRACVENATVPCIQTGTGNCHVYVDKAADLNMAVDIIENAKTSRPSVCNAEEVCLVHKDVAAGFLPLLKARLVDAPRSCRAWFPVDLRLDERAAAIIPGTPAGEQDFDTEFLNYILAIAWWMMWMLPLPTLPAIPPTTVRPSSRRTIPPQTALSPVWTAPPCM